MHGVKEIFKPGEVVVCVTITNDPFMGRKKPDVKTLTKGKCYTVLQRANPYNSNIRVINDQGKPLHYSIKRFVSIQKFRSPKIKKLMKRMETKK